MSGKLSVKNGRRMAGGKPIPKTSFALPAANGGQGGYPIDTIGRARNALSRVAQFGTPEQKAKVRSAVQRRYSQVNVTTNANGHPAIALASDEQGQPTMSCPRCGYSGGAGSFGNGTASDLQTPQPNDNKGMTGFSEQQITVKSGGSAPGLANGRGGIELARRLPVRTGADVIVSRQPGGSAVIRHRQGGNEIGGLKRNRDGTWQATLDGRELTPHRVERAALMEMLGVYNTGTVSAERPPMPLQQPPAQPELFSQLGVTNVRAFASDGNDDEPDDDSDDSGGSGLNPKGQGIYKKLKAKGVAEPVAMAMAKRAQNAQPGSFGSKS